jgi:hypothetical protein
VLYCDESIRYGADEEDEREKEKEKERDGKRETERKMEDCRRKLKCLSSRVVGHDCNTLYYYGAVPFGRYNLTTFRFRSCFHRRVYTPPTTRGISTELYTNLDV